MIHIILKHTIWFFLRLLLSTYKYEYRGAENLTIARSIHPKGSFIFSIWHEQVLSVMAAHAHTYPYMTLASRSKDGDFAAHIAQKLGFVSIRGSSRNKRADKGGQEALAEYIENLLNGVSGGVTIDGPKGPRHACKPGIVIMSFKTGCPIVPIVCKANSFWEFNSWDRFKLPKPFARLTIVYGKPIQIEKSNDPNIFKQGIATVEASMKDCMT